MHELSNQNFCDFKASIQKYIKRYNLGDWEYSIEIAHHLGGYACIDPNLANRDVKILINTADFEHDLTPQFMDKLAHHEVLEILLVDVSDIMLMTDVPSERIDTIRHAIINRLINQ